MEFVRLTDKYNTMYERAMELYGISFPYHERREGASRAAIISDSEYHFNLIYDDNEWVGLILCWENDSFIYVEHFCILPEKRNKKYGQKALEKLGEKGKCVILEIDPPKDDVSIRRKHFYERCGFVENPFSHVHPPYHKGYSGHELVVMTSPEKITEETYDSFKEYLDGKVMSR